MIPAIVCARANVVEDDAGIQWQVPVLISDQGIIEPLLQYLLYRKRVAQLLSRVMMRSGYQPVLLQMDESQMLAAVNALLRQMAKTADPDNRLSGFSKVAYYLDTDAFCDEPQWLASGIATLQTIDVGSPITLNQLRQLPEENRGE